MKAVKELSVRERMREREKGQKWANSLSMHDVQGVLRDVASHLGNIAHSDSVIDGVYSPTSIRDSNGNRVGSWSVVDEVSRRKRR